MIPEIFSCLFRGVHRQVAIVLPVMIYAHYPDGSAARLPEDAKISGGDPDRVNATHADIKSRDPVVTDGAAAQRRFQFVLIKPSHCDDDGYVIR